MTSSFDFGPIERAMQDRARQGLANRGAVVRGVLSDVSAIYARETMRPRSPPPSPLTSPMPTCRFHRRPSQRLPPPSRTGGTSGCKHLGLSSDRCDDRQGD